MKTVCVIKKVVFFLKKARIQYIVIYHLKIMIARAFGSKHLKIYFKKVYFSTLEEVIDIIERKLSFTEIVFVFPVEFELLRDI